MIAQVEKRGSWHQSETVVGTTGHRSSQEADLLPESNRIMAKLIRLVPAILGVPDGSWVERTDIIRYVAGQEFKPHYDASEKHLPRRRTLLLYLNTLDSGTAGGDTVFPLLNNYTIAPVEGSAVRWNNISRWGKVLPAALHQSLPITGKGVKYCMTFWSWPWQLLPSIPIKLAINSIDLRGDLSSSTSALCYELADLQIYVEIRFQRNREKRLEYEIIILPPPVPLW